MLNAVNIKQNSKTIVNGKASTMIIECVFKFAKPTMKNTNVTVNIAKLE